jgi:hypothetical protein
MMRIVFANGKQVGTHPVNHYVYLWRHGEVDRYVGKGVNDRWAAHTRPNPDDPNDRNEPKSRYFLAHWREMTCHVIAESLRPDEANERETIEIRSRGYATNGTGTLLNAKRGTSVALKPRAAPKPAVPRDEQHARKRLKCEEAYAKARTLGLSKAEIAFAGTGMSANSLRGKIARALCFMGPGGYTRAQVMRKADVGKLYDDDAFYIARAFFFRADLVGLAVDQDGESLAVREATADEKRDAIRLSAWLTDRPTAAVARISGFAGEVPEPDPVVSPPLTRFLKPL